ncbi:AI-2E family transporter [Patescibacteria group bacterium]|nr:AI-2E family transporter [Patescibacteria group bacterium]
MENKNSQTINISTTTILKLLLIFLIIVFLYLIKEVIASIFISLVLASAFDPWVDWFQKRKIPRGVAIIIIYLLLFAIISTTIVLIVPPITKEIGQIAKNFPYYYDKVIHGINYFKGVAPARLETELQQGIDSLSSSLPGAITNIFSTVFGFFGGIISFFLVLVITFYFTVEEEGLKSFIRAVSPSKIQPYINQLMFRIQRKMGLWLRGQLILSLIIFALVFIGLSILGVQYALLLALIAGLLEVIPFLGPTLAAIPAVFFGFLQSPLTGIFVIALYIIIQQLENHIIVPKVMGKTVGLNPLVVIVVILVGAKLGGVVGALLSVPVATGVSVFLSDFFEKKINTELKLEE